MTEKYENLRLFFALDSLLQKLLNTFCKKEESFGKVCVHELLWYRSNLSFQLTIIYLPRAVCMLSFWVDPFRVENPSSFDQVD